MGFQEALRTCFSKTSPQETKCTAMHVDAKEMTQLSICYIYPIKTHMDNKTLSQPTWSRKATGVLHSESPLLSWKYN